MTQQEMYAVKFTDKLNALHPNLKILSEYTDRYTCMDILCTVCNTQFQKTPRNLVAGRKSGCPNACAKLRNESARKKFKETKLKQQESKIKEFLSKTRTRMIGRNGTYEIRLKCLDCQHTWIGHSSMLFKYVRGGCRKCTTKSTGKEATLKLMSKIQKMSSDRMTLEFLDAKLTKVKGQCLICGSTWNTSWGSIKNGCGCLACAKRKQLESPKRKIKLVKVRGKQFKVTGYEDYVIKHLISKGVKAKDISTKPPIIKFRYNGRTINHTPDLKVSDEIIEVKSDFTFGLLGKVFGKNALSKTKAKAKAAISAGCVYTVYVVKVYKGEPIIIKMPSNWFTFPNKEIREVTLRHIENILVG